MTTQPVVVGVDGSAESDAALDFAVGLAARRQAPLRLVHALEPERLASWWTIGWTTDLRAADQQAAAELVQRMTERVAADHPEVAVECLVRDGAHRSVLVAESTDAQVVVVGSHRSGGLAAAALGSTCAEVGARVTCPLVAVPKPAGDRTQGSGVVVGVDGSPHSQHTLAYAFAEAAALGEAVTVVHAWTEPMTTDPSMMMALSNPTSYDAQRCAADERGVLSSCLDGWRARYPDVVVEECLQRSRPVDELITRSTDARLLVIGSHGSGGWRALLGSVSRGVLHAARVPVAIIHG